mgnify:CR=1 FL=1
MAETVRTTEYVGPEYSNDERTETAYPRVGTHGRAERGNDRGAKKAISIVSQEKPSDSP